MSPLATSSCLSAFIAPNDLSAGRVGAGEDLRAEEGAAAGEGVACLCKKSAFFAVACSAVPGTEVCGFFVVDLSSAAAGGCLLATTWFCRELLSVVAGEAATGCLLPG